MTPTPVLALSPATPGPGLWATWPRGTVFWGPEDPGNRPGSADPSGWSQRAWWGHTTALGTLARGPKLSCSGGGGCAGQEGDSGRRGWLLPACHLWLLPLFSRGAVSISCVLLRPPPPGQLARTSSGLLGGGLQSVCAGRWPGPRVGTGSVPAPPLPTVLLSLQDQPSSETLPTNPAPTAQSCRPETSPHACIVPPARLCALGAGVCVCPAPWAEAVGG